jgi:hypothetical protein
VDRARLTRQRHNRPLRRAELIAAGLQAVRGSGAASEFGPAAALVITRQRLRYARARRAPSDRNQIA